MTKRRSHGEGSIYKRKAGGWAGQLVVGRGANGALIRRTVYGPTQAEVLRKLDELRGDARMGLLPERASVLTLAAYLDHWLETLVKPHRAPNTYNLYKHMIKQRVTPFLGGVRLQQLRRHQLEALFGRLATAPRGEKGKRAKDPLSGRTQRILFNAVRKALRDAVQSKLIVHNPIEGVQAPREVQRTPRFMDREEAQQFLAAARGDPYEALFLIGVTSGLRLGELCGLRWRDIDMRRRELRIEQQLDARTMTLAPLKTPHSRRTVPIPHVAVEALRAHREKLGAIPHGDRLVFLSPQGTPIRGSNLRRRSFAAIVKAAGLGAKGLRLHDMRHTMATLMADEGAPLTAIQQRLGHSSLATTVKVYAHLTDRRAREAADLLDGVLGRA